MVNAWFPKLRTDGTIASGNAGIWISPVNGLPRQVSTVGTSPIWSADTIIYNRNDGTTQVGDAVLPAAFNGMVGCDCGQWAGFLATGSGEIRRYQGLSQIATATATCAPKFFGFSFGWLAPYQTGPDYQRTLTISGRVRASGEILDWFPDRSGAFYVYVAATGTYSRAIWDDKGNNVTIRSQADETPILCFAGPDGLPWILSNAPTAGTFVRMIYSAFGYVIPGDLYYPDARLIGDRLRVVGSWSDGSPRFDVWVDFTAPKVDLRTL